MPLSMLARSRVRCSSRQAYRLYVLLVTMIPYLINQMDRFVLGIGSRAIMSELKIGEIVCHSNLDHNLSSPADNGSCQDECSTLTTTQREYFLKYAYITSV